MPYVFDLRSTFAEPGERERFPWQWLSSSRSQLLEFSRTQKIEMSTQETVIAFLQSSKPSLSISFFANWLPLVHRSCDWMWLFETTMQPSNFYEPSWTRDVKRWEEKQKSVKIQMWNRESCIKIISFWRQYWTLLLLGLFITSIFQFYNLFSFQSRGSCHDVTFDSDFCSDYFRFSFLQWRGHTKDVKKNLKYVNTRDQSIHLRGVITLPPVQFW
jgi:hypothetical protein